MRGTVDRADEDHYPLQAVNRTKQSSQSGMSKNENVMGSKEELLNDPSQLMSRETIHIIPDTPRKRHLLPAFALFIYGFLLIISWVITGILSFKPLNAPQWHTEWSDPSIWPCHYTDSIIGTGFDCSGWNVVLQKDQLALNTRWLRVVEVIGSIMAVLSVPLSSAICARAAVVYIQNKSSGFSVSKTLALADRGWWDPVIAGGLLRRRGRDRYLSKFLLIATLVSVLGQLWNG